MPSEQISTKLIDRKNTGGLIKPHKDLTEMIKIADTVLECKIKKSKDIFSEKNIFQKLTIKALTVVSEERPSLLGEMDSKHDRKVISHRVKILKQACSMYFSMRIKYLIRLENEKNNTLCRHLNKKITLFKHE